MPSQVIQGLEVHWRDLREGEKILYADLPQEEQYFRKEPHPFTDEELENIAQLPYEQRSSAYNPLQKLWVEREEKRMDYGEGVYAMINGNLTYIPASYWGYINHWVLEHGEKPDYREADRIFFVFMEYLYFETEVLGITRGKGRRQGASSLGYYWMWWICGRLPEKRGGSLSFNDTFAQKNFQAMFMRGFKAMLPCFVRDFDSKAENFVRFVKAAESAKKGVIQKREGLNSYCDFATNSINAYDSGRISFVQPDETGKYDKMDVNTYWSKLSATLKIGRKKVGFAYMPTTVNPAKKGGENFKKFWDDANQNKINPKTGQPYGLNTPHKVVRYFVSAAEGYAGCIDKFGNSVIKDPEQPVMGNDGQWITEGAETVILKERELKEGEQLMEHRRDFPLNEFDMFSFQTGTCEFNEERIRARIQELEKNPVFWRQVRLQENYKTIKNPITGVEKQEMYITYMDDPKGCWWLLEEPMKPNACAQRANIYPENTQHYKAGIDNYRNIFAVEGSDGTITIMKNSNIINGEEKGMYPVLVFIGRPHLISLFNWEVFKACYWYGCKANYELDAGSWFYEDFVAWDAIPFLEWTPVREAKFNKQQAHIKPGTESASPFQLAKQLEVAKIYFDGNNPAHYNGHTERCSFVPLLKQALEYNHLERQPYHLMVSFMLALMPILGVIQKKKSPPPKQLLPTYKIEKYAS